MEQTINKELSPSGSVLLGKVEVLSEVHPGEPYRVRAYVCVRVCVYGSESKKAHKS